MPTIETKTPMKADLKTCFDLARAIEFHKVPLRHSNDKGCLKRSK
jgi:hypothetical protein